MSGVNVIETSSDRTTVVISLHANQRIVVNLTPAGPGRNQRKLMVRWQRRPSERFKWSGDSVEQVLVGHGTLDLPAFEVLP